MIKRLLENLGILVKEIEMPYQSRQAMFALLESYDMSDCLDSEDREIFMRHVSRGQMDHKLVLELIKY